MLVLHQTATTAEKHPSGAGPNENTQLAVQIICFNECDDAPQQNKTMSDSRGYSLARSFD